MNKEELLTIFSNILSEKNIIKTSGFDEDNFEPHQFTVGPEHSEYAAKHNDGILTEDICEQLGCKHSGCTLTYAEHKSDKTLILQLLRDVTHTEALDELLKIKGDLKKYEIKKVAFADTEEGYKFLND